MKNNYVSEMVKGFEKIPTNSDRVIGKKGEVTKKIESDKYGEVKVFGNTWTATSDKTIEVGKTAFDLVVADGYTGDMQDWLATLVTAKDKDGQNAFDVAAENGYKGSFAEWMAFLVNDNKQDEQKPDEFVIEKSYVDENNNLIRESEISFFCP